MKHIYLFLKNVPIAVRIGILFFFMIQVWASAQTNNDSTARITLPSDTILKKEVFVAPQAMADSLQRRKDVKTSTEVTEKGDTITRFIYEPFEFGEIYTANSAINANAKKASVLTSEPDAAGVESGGQMVASVTIQAIDPSKSVGQIPFDEGATPSGGKTITIPILTATVNSSAPQIALNYNSQMGNSMAG